MADTYWYGRGHGQLGDSGIGVEDLGDGRWRITPWGYSVPLAGGARGWTKGPSWVVTADSPDDAVAAYQELLSADA